MEFEVIHEIAVLRWTLESLKFHIIADRLPIKMEKHIRSLHFSPTFSLWHSYTHKLRVVTLADDELTKGIERKRERRWINKEGKKVRTISDGLGVYFVDCLRWSPRFGNREIYEILWLAEIRVELRCWECTSHRNYCWWMDRRWELRLL